MPQSKRAQKVSLTQTKKKGRARKDSLVEEVRSCADRYPSCYVLDAQNMRNTALKDVRARLNQTSRLFFGRTKLLSSALGRTPAEEIRDGLSQVAQGECALPSTAASANAKPPTAVDRVTSSCARPVGGFVSQRCTARAKQDCSSPPRP